MMQLSAPGVVHVAPPGDAVAVYRVIEAPPFETGADQLTIAEALPDEALTAVGGPGATATEGFVLAAIDDVACTPTNAKMTLDTTSTFPT